MKTEKRVRVHARTASVNLRQIITNNLAARREEAARHQKMVAENKKRAEDYEREYGGMLRKAVQGANNLVELHKTKDVQEMLALLVQVRGHNYELVIHESEADYGTGRWTRCGAYMVCGAMFLYVQQVGQVEAGKTEILSSLSYPGYYDGNREIDLTVRQEIERLHELYYQKPEWVVESVKAVRLHEGTENIPGTELPNEWRRMSWFAFLISCSDEEKLAKIMEAAFKKLEEK